MAPIPTARLALTAVLSLAISAAALLPRQAEAADPCVPVMDEAGNLICMLGSLAVAVPPLAPECPAEPDLKALGKRIVKTDAIGFFAKLRFKSDVDGLIDRGKRARDEGLTAEGLAGLRADYDDLVNRLVDKIDGDDPQLAADIACAREPLWRTVLNEA